MNSSYAAEAFATVFSGSILMIYVIFVLALAVLTIVGDWKLYVKAGKPGWACLIPFYNLYCKMDFCFGNGWLFLLFLIPCVNVFISIMLCFKLAKAFRQGVAFGFGLLFFPQIFTLILAFGNYQYYGVDGVGLNSADNNPYDDMSRYQ